MGHDLAATPIQLREGAAGAQLQAAARPARGRRAPRRARARTGAGVDVFALVCLSAIVVGLVNGYRRGFWLSLAQYMGFVGGVLLGATAAGPLLDYIGIHNPVARPLGAVLVLVIGGSLGSSIGFAAGEPLRRRILRKGTHTMPDSIGGAVLSAVAVLVMCWLLGLCFLLRARHWVAVPIA